MTKKKIFILNQMGEITIASIIVGALGAFIISVFTMMAIGDHYGSKYNKIKAEREIIAYPKRLEYVEKHPELDEDMKKNILGGFVYIGFTEEQVRIAENTWGEPKVNEGPDLPLGADKELIFLRAPEVKIEGMRVYYYFKNDKLIGMYGMPVKDKFSIEDRINIEKRYIKD